MNLMLKIGVYVTIIYTITMSIMYGCKADLFSAIMYGIINQIAWFYKPALFKQLDKDFK